MRTVLHRVCLVASALALVLYTGCPTSADDDTSSDDDASADDDTSTDDDTSGDDDISDDDTSGDDDDSSGDDDSSSDDDSAGDDDTSDDDDSAGDDDTSGDDDISDDDSTGDDDDTSGDDDDTSGDDDDTSGDDDDTSGDDDSTGDDDDTTGDDDDTTAPADADGDGWTVAAGDCDDNDFLVRPDFPELPCDGVDNDCDPATTDDPDGDGDGFGVCVDCDDHEPSIYPGAAEICNGRDDDCDGSLLADEVDDDFDDWMVCEGDCDDADRYTYPGALERCDEQDNDCDGTLPADELDDLDGDGAVSCLDCDDLDPTVQPGSPEVCGNGLDDDCDGGADDLDPDCACAQITPLFGDITISTDAAAQAFCSNYNAVYGSVHLSGLSLADTDGLACLCEISGDLTLDGAGLLEDASFPVLLSIGGDLSSFDNDHLEAIRLPNLEVLGGRLSIEYDDLIAELATPRLQSAGAVVVRFSALPGVHMPSLTSVTQEVYLWVNETTSVEMPRLQSTGDELVITERHVDGIVDLYSLNAVYGGRLLISLNFPHCTVLLPNLERTSGDLKLQHIYGSLTMSKLEEVGGNLFLHVLSLDHVELDLPLLLSVSGWVLITDYKSSLTINAPALRDIGDNLFVGHFTSAPAGTFLFYAPALEYVHGDVDLYANDDLQVVLWPGLRIVEGDLVVEDNPFLSDILSLFTLEEVTGDVVFQNNGMLATSQILALVDDIGIQNITGSVIISGNAP